MTQRGCGHTIIIGICMRPIQGDLDGIDRGDGRHAPQECNRAKQHGSTDENDNDRGIKRRDDRCLPLESNSCINGAIARMNEDGAKRSQSSFGAVVSSNGRRKERSFFVLFEFSKIKSKSSPVYS